MTKEEAEKFIRDLDPYSKYGKVIYLFDNLDYIKLIYEYATINCILLHREDGQFSGGYGSEIYKVSETETVIFDINPDGIPTEAEGRAKELNND